MTKVNGDIFLSFLIEQTPVLKLCNNVKSSKEFVA